MAPYRRGKTRAPVAEAPTEGLVADMVKQFADSYAFLRELCQNSIDAGTPQVEVSITRGSASEVTTSVSDTGSGMTLEILENSLLTLFSSSKEGDDSKIGKYGVGFVSVLAIEPLYVVVETWRDGRTLRVRIARDHRYVIEELEAKEGHGTRVTLEHELSSEAFREHAARAETALVRWCRHARVPIHVTLTDYSSPADSRRTRIDRPLSVFAVTHVEEAGDDYEIVVGPALGSSQLPRPADLPENEAAERFAGFYNRGLTLYESTVEVFEGLDGARFKISSSRLKHTLSRDDVRRDRGLEKLVARAVSLCSKELPRHVVAELRAAAENLVSTGRFERYVALLEAGLGPPLSLDAKRVAFPLTDPVQGKQVQSAHDLVRSKPWGRELLASPHGDVLTAALAAEGRAVVLGVDPFILLGLCKLGIQYRYAHATHVFTTEIPSSEIGDSDRELLVRLARVLERGKWRVKRVAFASAVGAATNRAVIALDETGLASVDEAKEAAGEFERGATLFLDTREESVKRARNSAKTQPDLAAELLARVVLLDRLGALPEAINDALLELATGANA
jgi:molecular chaperone HtpG